MPASLTLMLVPLCLLLGALAAAGWARLHFARTGPTFPCKLRWPDLLWPAHLPYDAAPTWPRRKVWGRWAHDVLLIQRGILCPRTVVLPACFPDQAIRNTTKLELGGLGANPVVFPVRLDDGRVVEVAAREADISALAGPFLAAAIPGVGRKAPQRRPRGG